MNNKILELDVKSLNLQKKLIDALYEKNIYKIQDLWLKKRKDLKTLGFSNEQIKIIVVQLQLIGIDLNKKIY